jgi:hypothetical protein
MVLGKLVLVEWVDAVGDNSWENAKTMGPLPLALHTFVGFMTEKTADYLTLAMGGNEDFILCRHSIPMATVKTIRYLEV